MSDQKKYRLDEIEGLRRLFELKENEVSSSLLGKRFGRLFCPRCGDFRSMDLALLWEAEGPKKNRELIRSRRAAMGVSNLPRVDPGPEPQRPFVPSVYRYSCRECSTEFTALVYRGVDGPDLVVLPSTHGGLRTSHTPEAVAFYLDQAYRAEATGARSAAVAMYRAALEHLLFEQEYRDRMLGPKLRKLEEGIEAGTAPKWARDLETEFLTVLKDLGDASIHPNAGDVSRQAELDTDLLARVKETFLHLLFIVYEAEHERKERLGTLQSTANSFKK